MKVSVNAGDWFKGWGYGSNNKIGKLSTVDGKEFLWKGHSQGRHGQKWNRGAWVSFKLKDSPPGFEIIDSHGGTPSIATLMEQLPFLMEKWDKAKAKQDRLEAKREKASKLTTVQKKLDL